MFATFVDIRYRCLLLDMFFLTKILEPFENKKTVFWTVGK